MAKQKNHAFYRRLFKSRKPGQSLADLARQNRIEPRRLYSYRSYLKRQEEKSEEPASLPAFLPLVLKPQVNPSDTHSFDLAIERLGNLTIPADFEGIRPEVSVQNSQPKSVRSEEFLNL
ncbi:MAG: hypothetical protein P1V97_36770 [Planctomycetota bacterium]|nr:hypothetical protein [Planctomycetota bacterium]